MMTCLSSSRHRAPTAWSVVFLARDTDETASAESLQEDDELSGSIASACEVGVSDIPRPEVLAPAFADARTSELLCLLLYSVCLASWGLCCGPALSDHEAIVAVGARGIRQSEDWLVPRVGEEEFVRKPPLSFWLAALSSYVVDPPGAVAPVSVMAARLPGAVAAPLCMLVLYFLGRAMYGHRGGLISAAVFASCLGTFYFSHNAQVEMVLVLFSTSTVACFWFSTEGHGRPRLWMALAYASFAMAMMSKAPVPLATVVLPLVVWWMLVLPWLEWSQSRACARALPPRTLLEMLVNRLRRLRCCWSPTGLLLFVLLFAPWPLYLMLTREGVLDLWQIEFIGRYTGDLTQSDHSALYYLPIVAGLLLPFSLSLPESVLSGFLARYASQRRALLFCLTWAAVQIAFFSTSAFKRPHYLACTLPPLALLVGPCVDRLFFGEQRIRRDHVRMAMVALVLLLIGGGWVASHRLRAELPAAMTPFWTALALLTVGVLGCCWAFASGRRGTSFLLLLITAAVTAGSAWQSLGGDVLTDRRVAGLIEGVRASAIDEDAVLVWVGGRPDARLMYYGGLKLRPVFSALELAPSREGRRAADRGLVDRMLTRIRGPFERGERQYVIVKGQYWDALHTRIDDVAQVEFRVSGDHGNPGDDWVVLTNRAAPDPQG